MWDHPLQSRNLLGRLSNLVQNRVMVSERGSHVRFKNLNVSSTKVTVIQFRVSTDSAVTFPKLTGQRFK